MSAIAEHVRQSAQEQNEPKPRRKYVGEWKDEHSAFLQELIEGKCHSYAQIAAELNARFGTSHSRSSCIGRANRMGLSNNATKSEKHPGGRPRRESGLRLVSVTRRPYIRKAPPPVLVCVPVEPRNVSLLDLQPGECRYPYGEHDYTFCGHPVFNRSSWCAPHWRSVTEQRMPRE